MNGSKVSGSPNRIPKPHPLNVSPTPNQSSTQTDSTLTTKPDCITDVDLRLPTIQASEPSPTTSQTVKETQNFSASLEQVERRQVFADSLAENQALVNARSEGPISIDTSALDIADPQEKEKSLAVESFV